MKISFSEVKYKNNARTVCAERPVATSSFNYQTNYSGQSFSYPKIYFLGQNTDFSCETALSSSSKRQIRNFRKLGASCARGESLSSERNSRRMPNIKRMGIEDVIDLRDKYTSEKYPQLCEENGLNYYNIPIDSDGVPTDKVIKNLPLLFELLDKKKFYIACAQGLHRTDIALALHYIFNSDKAKMPPDLPGHQRDDHFKYDDIFRRANSIKNEMTAEDMKKLGLDEDFDEIFKARKKELIRYNQRTETT